MKKLKTILCGDAARLSLAGLAVFLCVFASFSNQGISATVFPLVLAGVLIPFFYDEARLLVPIAAVSAVLLSLVLQNSPDAYLFYPIVLTLFFAAALGVSRLLRFFAEGREKRTPALCGVLALFFLIAAWFLVFGNPVSLIIQSRMAIEGYEARYTGEDFTLADRCFDPLARRYTITVETASGVFFSAATDQDGYLELMKTHAAALQKSELLSLLHENFSDGNYLITLKTGDTPSQAISPYVYGDMPEEWLRENEITLEFDSSVSVGTPDAKASFASRIRRYVTLLNENGFPYASITFRGGEMGRMVYELSATPNTPIDELVAPNVIDLDE